MTDFDQMAKAAKTATEARIAEAEQTRREADEERRKRIAALQSQLEEQVLPTLEAAADAFKRQGIEVLVKRDWDTVPTGRPTVSFLCEGPRITNHFGGFEIPRGAKIEIFHESDKLVVKTQKWRGDDIEGWGGALPDALKAAITYALKTYLESLEEIRSRG